MSAEDKEQIFDLALRALNGLVAFVATVGITLAGFALKSNYDSQLSLRELDVRITSVEKNARDDGLDISKNSIKLHQLELQHRTVEGDIKTIKEDIGEIKALLKKEK